MEYKRQPAADPPVSPRLIIHGGAGNIRRASAADQLAARAAVLSIVEKTHSFMHTRRHRGGGGGDGGGSAPPPFPTALETATYAVTLLEDCPEFNSGKGAVFTRDGVNELEASVMVTRGFAKRGVGVTGLRRVRNPAQLARALLEHGGDDLVGRMPEDHETGQGPDAGPGLDVPSAQGHTLLHGPTAELLAARYGLALVEPSYFFTQRRWDEHVRGLERERRGELAAATWSDDEYLPQGTCGAVALDRDGVVCCATSTGGLTNKLTGRIGDTPVVGAGFWAEEWQEPGDRTASGRRGRRGEWAWDRAAEHIRRPGRAAFELAGALRGLVADCLPTPFVYSPAAPGPAAYMTTTRSVAVSGTGNGDSFLRVAAARSVAGIARWRPAPSADALTRVTGPEGELQRSAGWRWGRTGQGEGEGGMIGIEAVVVRDAEGRVLETRSEILQDFNCAGMIRAWIDDQGKAVARIWRDERGVVVGWR